MKITEEKAKRYDDVVSKLERFMAQGVDPLITRADVQDFFPELAESEDEKIRKLLIRKITQERGSLSNDEATKCIDWLEKQGKHVEQKPAKWSEEDNAMLIEIEDILTGRGHSFYDKEISWLKSLSPQSQWKPSDEQLEALESATANCAYSEYQDCLRELIGQLKKLKR